MATVRIELPSLLSTLLSGQEQFDLSAGTLAEALAAIRADHPTLAVHVFDESGELRQHVLCFHNDVNTRWLNPHDIVLTDGDTLRFYQAVSGG